MSEKAPKPPIEITVNLDASEATPEQMERLLSELMYGEDAMLPPAQKFTFALGFWNEESAFAARQKLRDILAWRASAIGAKVTMKLAEEPEGGRRSVAIITPAGKTPLEEAMARIEGALAEIDAGGNESAVAEDAGEPPAEDAAPAPWARVDLPLDERIVQALAAFGPMSDEYLAERLGVIEADVTAALAELFNAGRADPDGPLWYLITPEEQSETGDDDGGA